MRMWWVIVILCALSPFCAVGDDLVPVIEPICLDAESCYNERQPLRTAVDPTQPLTETGGWGFSYGPLPVTEPGEFPNDYMMADWMRGQWAEDGRNDLQMIADMGAKMVRLYGNDPRFSATEFLNRANTLGLKVIAGISDYPYSAGPDKCTESLDCYKAVKDSYNGTLDDKGGQFLFEKGKYHPALDALIIVNEPDLKFQSGGAPDENYARAIISAFDGILAAEEAQGVDITSSDNIKLTATFSYAVCPLCPNILKLKELGCCIPCHDPGETLGGPLCSTLGDAGEQMKCPAIRKADQADDCPGLPMVMDLYTAFENPMSVGYTFRTENWREAYLNRFVHSFNGFVRADIMYNQFLSKYMELPFNQGKDPKNMTPVFMGEYGDQLLAKNTEELSKDLMRAKEIVKDNSNPFFGFNFFQFEVAYWKPCSDPSQWDSWVSQYWGNPETAPNPGGDCGERLFGTFSSGDIIVGKTGGVNDDSKNIYDIMCQKPIFRGKPEAVAGAFGGKAPDTTICEAGWESDTEEYCVAVRGDKGILGKGLQYACEQLAGAGEKDCTDGLPAVCDKDVYGQADWAFSMFFENNKNKAANTKAQDICNFGGAAVVTAIPSRPECVFTTRMKAAPPPEPNPSPSPGDNGGDDNGGNGDDNNDPDADASKEEKGGGSSLILIVLAVLVLAAAGAVVYMKMSQGAAPTSSGSPSTELTESNLT